MVLPNINHAHGYQNISLFYKLIQYLQQYNDKKPQKTNKKKQQKTTTKIKLTKLSTVSLLNPQTGLGHSFVKCRLFSIIMAYLIMTTLSIGH